MPHAFVTVFCFHRPYFKGLFVSLERDFYYKGICPLFCHVCDFGCLSWHNLVFGTGYTLHFFRPCQTAAIKGHTTNHPRIFLPLAFISHTEHSLSQKTHLIAKGPRGSPPPATGCNCCFRLFPFDTCAT